MTTATAKRLSAEAEVKRSEISYKEDPCTLFSMTQYQCTPLGGRVTCWPLERVFRQCGQGKPSIEVTNRLVPPSSSASSSSSSNANKETYGQDRKNSINHAQSQSQDQTRPQHLGPISSSASASASASASVQREEELIVDPKFIANPPKARNWSDYRGQ
ncbi:hypothetical protein IAT40_004463 [Kwoniella sp. CBS 6097]